MTSNYTLPQLGWQPYFQQQLSLDEWEDAILARVTGVERSLLHLLTVDETRKLPVTPSMPGITVGDWLLLDKDGHFLRLLDRYSLFSRKAAGKKVASQLIAANIDTVFIVTSLNQDFNLNRIERYLTLANEAGVEPVIVLSKLDCCDEPDTYLDKIRTLRPAPHVLLINSLETESVQQLLPWCGEGKSVAFLGSSGVGKSTIINTLLDKPVQGTQSIREDDAKGRHTTTSRSLHLLLHGGWLLDTPGMRELQLADCEHGVEETFPEITELTKQCKFSDCQHQGEPGCAVRAAIDNGTLDERRLASYQKLMREQQFNTASLAERRAQDREFGRYVRSVMDSKKKDDGY